MPEGIAQGVSHCLTISFFLVEGPGVERPGFFSWRRHYLAHHGTIIFLTDLSPFYPRPKKDGSSEHSAPWQSFFPSPQPPPASTGPTQGFSGISKNTCDTVFSPASHFCDGSMKIAYMNVLSEFQN